MKKVDEDENETDSGLGFGKTETRIVDGVAMTVSTAQIADNKLSPRNKESAKKSHKVCPPIDIFLQEFHESIVASNSKTEKNSNVLISKLERTSMQSF